MGAMAASRGMVRPVVQVMDEKITSRLPGGLEHVLLSPLVGMMIQSDFHIFQGG